MATPGPDRIHHLAPDSAGYTSVETDHHWVIRFTDCQPFRLPKGEHSRQAARTGGVHIGTIKSMCRRFAIMDCARQVLPQLR